MSLPQFRRTGVGADARRGMIRPDGGNEGNAGEIQTSTLLPLASLPPHVPFLGMQPARHSCPPDDLRRFAERAFGDLALDLSIRSIVLRLK